MKDLHLLILPVYLQRNPQWLIAFGISLMVGLASTVQADMFISGDYSSDHCGVQGNVLAGGDIRLQGCQNLKQVMAGGNIHLSDSRIEKGLKAGRSLWLKQADITGDVLAAGDIHVEHSRILGTLMSGAEHLVLENSQVGQVEIQGNGSNVVYQGLTQYMPELTQKVYSRGGSRVIIGSGNTVISNRNGSHSNIQVSQGGVSHVNGYTVQAEGSQTSVLTPEGNIYINGKRVSGNGPKTYVDYQTSHPSSPSVNGPGWFDAPQAGEIQPETSNEQVESSRKYTSPKEVVELRHGTTITGDIVFQSGHGVVILGEGSKVLGKISGGDIQRL